MDHHHQHPLKNSNHATSTTSSTALTSTMTATQMRATLIYLAPFLQPCKNVVPGTTTTTSLSSSTTRAQHLQPNQTKQPQQQHNKKNNNNNEKDIAAILDKTHVARNRASGSASVGVSMSSSRNNHNNAINCNSNNNNTNNNITTINASRFCCCSNSLNCTTTDTTGSSSRIVDDCNIAISSSCCHNTTEKVEEHKQQHQHQDSKQVKEQKKTQRDTEYYENYEMPALETTTTTTNNNNTTTTMKTTTMLNSTNNIIRQQQQEREQQHPVVVIVAKEVKIAEANTKQGNPSLSSQTSSCFSTSTSSASISGSSASTSFVNYTNNNNRSTKYLRERVRRHSSTTQQTLKQQQQQQTHGLTVTATLQRRQGDKEEEVANTNVKQEQENQLQQQQRKTPCGHSPPPLHCDNNHIATTTRTTTLTKHCNNRMDNDNNRYNNNNNQNNNTINSNTSVLSRCHCSNNQHNNIMLTNVQDMKKEQMMQMQTKTSTNCDDGQKQDECWVVENKKMGKNEICLILRNSQREQQQQQNNSYLLDYKDRNEQASFYTENDLTTSALLRNSYYSSTPLSSLALQPYSVSSSTLSSSSTTNTTSSYTTILNKECRCFRNKRDIIIGSECNIEQIKNHNLNQQQKLGTSTGVATSSAASLSETYCMINDKRGSAAITTPTSSFVSNATCQWLVASIGCSKLTKTVAVSKWLFIWLLFVMLTSSAHCWAGRNEVPTNCTFPARWEGSWFLSGYQQSIHIKGSQFSYRGRCAASDGNKYLIVDEKGCHRCLVIYEKHKNVLQYKESECEGDSMYMHQTNPSAMAMRSVLNQKTNNNGGDHRGGAHPNLNGHSRLSSSDQYIMRSNDDMNDYFCKGRETLQNLCDQIPGDALLYSLFRESAEPVKCPLKGPFIFTYNRGNGECKSPVSNIESCTEDSRLLLSFQACPDVVGTESTVEELTCLATWKDGNSRYLVGLVSHHHAISNEERYRCFVYEKISSLMDLGHFAGPSMSTSKDAEYKLAQSGDATCNGLDSAEVGSRIMSLRKPPITERCDFPVWFKGPRHWHVLMGNAVYNYHTNDGSIHIIKPNGYMETRALCEQINKQTPTEMMSVVHYTTGCQSGFMCMMFYRRDTHVIEIQTGKPASRLEDACAPDHFDILKTPYITLLASNPDPQICPMEGLYSLKGAIGPPYLTTRHKRNHNNKIHGLHNHHHQLDSLENAGRGYLHKRHSSLSFRNSQHDEKNAWHSNTRGLPIRSRRDASSTAIPLASSSNQTQEILVVGNNTNVGFVRDPDSDTRLRSRRNVPECVTNYKAQRQLWVGCTEPNVIDVRPLCNDEGDEEYSCHGSWSENSTVYIIARHKGTKHGVCISYRPTEGTAAKLVVGDACYRGTQKPPDHHLVANLSVFGKCGETGSTSSTIPVVSWCNLFMATILIIFLSQWPIQR